MEDENILVFVRFKQPLILGYGLSSQYCFISEDRLWTIEQSTKKGFEFLKKCILNGLLEMRITEIQLIKPKLFEPAY